MQLLARSRTTSVSARARARARHLSEMWCSRMLQLWHAHPTPTVWTIVHGGDLLTCSRQGSCPTEHAHSPCPTRGRHNKGPSERCQGQADRGATARPNATAAPSDAAQTHDVHRTTAAAANLPGCCWQRHICAARHQGTAGHSAMSARWQADGVTGSPLIIHTAAVHAWQHMACAAVLCRARQLLTSLRPLAGDAQRTAASRIGRERRQPVSHASGLPRACASSPHH